ncbi:hypothetical protein K437DRAFT_256684 [Tilletiaria anomala UBC 951]|uniref:Uncharacterized protein n=1 Tax=Tilletiaria anomala (strain ATCC 24038 / CBS 436.72 / UBC 951) TaxID=1037660 RepID=A0A066VUS7_TILAU|nr:uncharacterized protein K437DRAFT_256684 [Tilletiaria anomala UBC 951]KDN45236.1 hypothetical protein K437DRAFT_256684 [Tilletiaria anomala UBC 951]
MTAAFASTNILPSSNGYSYAGCYADTSKTKVLWGSVTNDDTINTVRSCVSARRAQDYQIAGVKAGTLLL